MLVDRVVNVIMSQETNEPTPVYLLQLKNKRQYKYYCALIELFAGLCLGRNYTAINILEEVIPKEILVCGLEEVERNKLDDEMKSMYTRLLLRLHLD